MGFFCQALICADGTPIEVDNGRTNMVKEASSTIRDIDASAKARENINVFTNHHKEQKFVKSREFYFHSDKA